MGALAFFNTKYDSPGTIKAPGSNLSVPAKVEPHVLATVGILLIVAAAAFLGYRYFKKG